MLSAWIKMKKNYGFVKAKGRLIFVKNVEFIDIEESMSGMDVMTFRYEGEIYKSYIFLSN